MFFLKQDDKYWDGKEWIEDWHNAICYGSAATAVNHAPNRTCLATSFTLVQWDAYNGEEPEATASGES
jgi:hypothetical protein